MTSVERSASPPPAAWPLGQNLAPGARLAHAGGLGPVALRRRVFLAGLGWVALLGAGCASRAPMAIPGRAGSAPRPPARARGEAEATPEVSEAAEELEPAGAAAEGPVMLRLPDRPDDAQTGSAFLEQHAGRGRAAFDEAVVSAVTMGNVPAHQRRLLPLEVADPEGRTATLHVLCDYLAIGSDDDFVRMPMTSAAAQRIADLTDTTLPTKKVVDEIYRQAEAKLPPSYIDGGPTDDEVADFLLHHEKLEARRRALGLPLGVLTAGNKKDIVLSTRMLERPERVAIYGWHRRDGEVIQPLSATHSTRYADYSHGVRLIDQRVVTGSEERRFTDIAADPELASLVSDEGPLPLLAYPTTLPEYAGPSRRLKRARR